MFSQMRGGDTTAWGPISRRFSRTVPVLSGKFTVKPTVSAHETETMCSPIHASGRNDTKSSSGRTGSTSCICAAIDRRLRWLSSASLGRLVVPEVVQSRAVASGSSSATPRSKRPGSPSCNARPRPSTSEKKRSLASS